MSVSNISVNRLSKYPTNLEKLGRIYIEIIIQKNTKVHNTTF